MEAQSSIRVLVVDDSDVVRMKLRKVLLESGLEVAGEAADGISAVEATLQTLPDVVVMDLQMPGMSGIEATWKIGTDAPSVPVLVLTVSDDSDDVASAVMAGARGYVLKDSGEAEIVAAIRAVAQGETVISPEIASVLVERGGPAPERPPERAIPFAVEVKVPHPAPAEAVPPLPLAAPPAERYEQPGNDVTEAPQRLLAVLAAGAVLTLVGQGQALAHGHMTARTWLAVLANFLVSLAVWELAAALRPAPQPMPPPRTRSAISSDSAR